MREPAIIGDATLYLGDCMDILPTLHGVGAIVSDPPYGIGFSHGGNDKSGIGGGRYKTEFNGVKIHGDDAPFDPAQWLALDVPTILWGGQSLCRAPALFACMADMGQESHIQTLQRLRRLRISVDKSRGRGAGISAPMGWHDESL